MLKQVFITSLKCLGAGLLIELSSYYLGMSYLHGFYSGNLVMIMIAMMAINSTTQGVILSRIKQLTDAANSNYPFKSTLTQMKLAVLEQIALIALVVIILLVESSSQISLSEEGLLVAYTLLSAAFIYSLCILYDTANAVFIIMEFEG